MKSKEVEKAKSDFDFFYEGDWITREMEQSKDIVLEYIKKLEIKLKEMGKGQQSLINSRRKWKNRYYNERQKVKRLKSEINLQSSKQT